MPPTEVLSSETVVTGPVRPKDTPLPRNYEWEIKWRNVIVFAYLHLQALYGIYLMLTFNVSIYTIIWTVAMGTCSGFSITLGAHRLWSHRAYKARWPLKVVLMLFNSMAFQNHIYEWARDHRVHHKYTDTDADPHNSKRGFFFCHMGWLLVKKQPDIMMKGKGIDLSDLEQDSVVMFQKKHYWWLMPLWCFVLPAMVPCYFWGEDALYSWSVSTCYRYISSLHFTWCVNSVAHMFGTRPYDKNITPVQNAWVAWGALGEGWHNYHHVFPWDYKAAEFGNYTLNISTALLDLLVVMGQAFELKSVSAELIKKRVQRTGDGSHHSPEWDVWGWGDPDLTEEERRLTKITAAAGPIDSKTL